MAETTGTTQQGRRSGQEAPVLRPGRPADPAPAAERRTAAGAEEPVTPDSGTAESSVPAVAESSRPDQSQQDTDAEKAAASEGAGAEPEETERQHAESRQHKLRLLLRQCDRVLLLDFSILDMPAWPDSHTMAIARRQRDLWLFCALLAATVFFSGMTGFVPAWVAGSGFGAFVIILLLGVPAIRRIYTSQPSYLELLRRRRQLLRDARKHIAHLEGTEGLAWQCAQMAEFNPALLSRRFSRLRALSERRQLVRHLVRRGHIRLYLLYMMEAEKAYNRLEQAFFRGHQKAIDRGWASAAARPER